MPEGISVDFSIKNPSVTMSSGGIHVGFSATVVEDDEQDSEE